MTESKKKPFNCLLIVLALALMMVAAACEKPETVSFDEKEEIKMETGASLKRSLRISVGAMITPSNGFAYYRQLLDYIGGKLDMPVEFIAKESYAESNELLRTNKVDVAFVCGQPYVDGNEEFGLEILVVPVVNGKTVYYSYLIVHNDSSLKSLDDLCGKSFAFTDPKSNSGKLVPTYLLSKMGETPESFFSRYIFTSAHDKSIKAVAQNIVDGAAVDSLIYDYENKFTPEYAEKTRVIFRSAPYGIPPVVVPREIDPELKESFKAIFLSIHNDPDGISILKKMGIDRFVEGDDSAYDGIRDMKKYLARQKP